MVSEETYESCIPILEDSQLEEEEKTEKIEGLLRTDFSLEGKELEEAVLGTLWRHRLVKHPSKSNAPVRHGIVRSSSPSVWQQSQRTSTPSIPESPGQGRASPILHTGYNPTAPAFIRSRSFGTSSPFSSPRPSPRLAFAAPIPHSPSISNYAFSDDSGDKGDYGDYGSDTVDWLVNDDTGSRPSSSGAGSVSEGGLNAAASPWALPQASEMSSYDMLRSVTGDGKSDEEIEAALEANGYDLSSTVMSLMGMTTSQSPQEYFAASDGNVLIGKSMTTSQPIAINHGDHGRSNVICKYWLTNGSCLRADCRFSHDLSGHICKYWLTGSCLSGNSCMFSHDPALLMSRMNLGDASLQALSGQQSPNFQVQDRDAFPVLQPSKQSRERDRASSPMHFKGGRYGSPQSSPSFMGSPRRQFEPRPSAMTGTGSAHGLSGSRPGSRNRIVPSGITDSIPAVDDADAFPSLGITGVKAGKKHHGKRGGHGNSHASKENVASSIADIVRMSPGSSEQGRKGLAKTKSNTYVSTASSAIPAPQHIPWLETGAKADQEYNKARQEAFKHGAMRNKFLQSAAQAWNRNDARAAKALSLRGQSENDLMRKAHREAARVLYESRNKDSDGSREIFVDLHGLHPDEAIEFLEEKLGELEQAGRIVYAVTGTGHHSKNGKDKIGKAVRNWLSEWKYTFKEFSAGGTEGFGGILGINPSSFDRSLVVEKERNGPNDRDRAGEPGGSSTKVKVVKAADREEVDQGEAG